MDYRIFRRSLTRLGCCIALAAVAACRRAPSPPQFEPYGSLSQVLADFAAHLNDDLYRFPYPRDLAGQNLFRATLKRLDHYQSLHPGVFVDELAVARGQAYERLGDFASAVKAYENLGPKPTAKLAAAVEQSLGYLRQLAETASRECDVSSLPNYLADLQRKRTDLDKLADKFRGTHYEALARIEAEKIDVARAVLLFNNRYLLPGGLQGALQAMAELIDRRGASRLARRHQILLGDFYFAAAKDCCLLDDPEQSGFDKERFDALAAAARETYFKVSQMDGVAEKPEARAKLQALEAFARNVGELAQ